MRIEQSFKYPLSEPSQPLESSKTIQQYDSTFKTENRLQSPYSTPNDSKVNLEVKEPRYPISESLSEVSKSPFKTAERSEEYNTPSDQEKYQNRLNFITLGSISEQKKIEIIQKGFQLNQQGKIALKKYYEGTETDSLFQLKGYRIKYESIRRTKLYQQLKK